MNRVTAFGVVLTATGLVAYAVGVTAVYPGRAFSVTVVMAGLALATMGRAADPAEVER